MVLRNNTIIQQSWNESFQSIYNPGKPSNLEFICTFLKSPWIEERFLEHLGDLLMVLQQECTENSPDEVEMTHLPAGPRKARSATACIPLCPSEITRSTLSIPQSFNSAKRSPRPVHPRSQRFWHPESPGIRHSESRQLLGVPYWHILYHLVPLNTRYLRRDRGCRYQSAGRGTNERSGPTQRQSSRHMKRRSSRRRDEQQSPESSWLRLLADTTPE